VKAGFSFLLIPHAQACKMIETQIQLALGIAANRKESAAMRVGIIGAGPGGSLCASVLGQAGIEAHLFDFRGAWEKPCGGGVTPKALTRYPFLKDCLESKRNITQMEFISAENALARVGLIDPLLIYSRSVLNQLLLNRALGAGVEFHAERVAGFERDGSQWMLQTQAGTMQVDFLVGADGIDSLVRKRLSERFQPADLMMTYGYRIKVPSENRNLNRIQIKFFKELSGYLWVFPRLDNISVGICGKLARHPTGTLKQLLQDFVEQYAAENLCMDGLCSLRTREDAAPAAAILPGTQTGSDPVRVGASRLPAVEIYSALIPSLQAATLRNNRVSGPGWALIGDAAGFADPITCEGIYYALRSGELLAQTLIDNCPQRYALECQKDFVGDFIRAAEIFERLYFGTICGVDILSLMVRTVARSQTLRNMVNALIIGHQNYQTLKASLLRQSPRVLLQLATSFVS
jgi:flavin-dependent dehydrogenase